MLNALGCYLLISLLFVFIAMYEFELVLLLKQKNDLKKDAIHFNDDGLILKDRNKPKTVTFSINTNWIAPSEETKIDRKAFGGETLGLFYALPFTTRLDLLTFIFFNSRYFNFNCIYLAIYL